MLYFILNEVAAVIAVSSKIDRIATPKYVTRNDFRTLESAEHIAFQASQVTGDLHLAIDGGEGCYPRYDVIRAPKVGDKVSQSFNGDSYPRGTIVKVSKTLKLVTTDTGHKFYRLRNTGSWQINGYASMIQGHISEQNPSF